ncbi:hypothetical protein MARPO_0082s0033 [Marchantia polymorpha]|uniref:Uncharacterized protein n=1 Tax=Marchantia polymorpha TaxID=3197 RepID=A0A2R6WK06_MARPO|nr:hypothetical protein MARPO_0082s0033 [Marchantia polymorpha]|eukprot:PTQ34182.1 hypothetical protein MARPO_0082s0033 [Marchantia polymorpha]
MTIAILLQQLHMARRRRRSFLKQAVIDAGGIHAHPGEGYGGHAQREVFTPCPWLFAFSTSWNSEHQKNLDPLLSLVRNECRRDTFECHERAWTVRVHSMCMVYGNPSRSQTVHKWGAAVRVRIFTPSTTHLCLPSTTFLTSREGLDSTQTPFFPLSTSKSFPTALSSFSTSLHNCPTRCS